MDAYQLAQLNVARMKFPLDDVRMNDFVDALGPINALADAAPGFVWRLQDDAGDAISFRILDDDLLLVNLTVWESVDALKSFSYRTDHGAIFRRRAEWFERPDGAHLVLWWVPEGHIPTVEEAGAGWLVSGETALVRMHSRLAACTRRLDDAQRRGLAAPPRRSPVGLEATPLRRSR